MVGHGASVTDIDDIHEYNTILEPKSVCGSLFELEPACPFR